MQAVMYHYVRPDTDRPPYEYYYLDLEDFKRQLDQLEEPHELIGRESFLSHLRGDTMPAEGEAILTFDDGLRDHYEWVLPELDRRNLWGLFFVPGPIGETLLPVHRIHTMLGSADPETLADVLVAVINERDILEENKDEFSRAYAQYESNDGTNWFKRTLNYFVPYERLPEVFGELERRVPGVRWVDPSEYYMNQSQLRELADAGMLLGAHTVTHPVLSRLSTGSQREEIQRSLEFVQDIAAPPVRTFAYPYGGTEVFSKTTIEILDDADCDAAFTTEPGDISPDALQTNPLTLRRRDCNEFEHGSASIT